MKKYIHNRGGTDISTCLGQISVPIYASVDFYFVTPLERMHLNSLHRTEGSPVVALVVE